MRFDGGLFKISKIQDGVAAKATVKGLGKEQLYDVLTTSYRLSGGNILAYTKLLELSRRQMGNRRIDTDALKAAGNNIDTVLPGNLYADTHHSPLEADAELALSAVRQLFNTDFSTPKFSTPAVAAARADVRQMCRYNRNAPTQDLEAEVVYLLATNGSDLLLPDTQTSSKEAKRLRTSLARRTKQLPNNILSTYAALHIFDETVAPPSAVTRDTIHTTQRRLKGN